jgi:hypothetical protein
MNHNPMNDVLLRTRPIKRITIWLAGVLVSRERAIGSRNATHSYGILIAGKSRAVIQRNNHFALLCKSLQKCSFHIEVTAFNAYVSSGRRCLDVSRTFFGAASVDAKLPCSATYILRAGCV